MGDLLADKKSYICKCNVLFILLFIVEIMISQPFWVESNVIMRKVSSRYFRALYIATYKVIM